MGKNLIEKYWEKIQRDGTNIYLILAIKHLENAQTHSY